MAKNRPYMIISHIATPVEGTKTHLKGWTATGKMLVREHVEFDHRLRDKDKIRAGVIIDIHSRTVVKNRFAEDQSDAELVEHYFTKYNGQMARYLAEYLRRFGRPEAEAKLAAMLDDERTALDTVTNG